MLRGPTLDESPRLRPPSCELPQRKNGAKLGINADKAQLFLKNLSKARKNPPQAVCKSRLFPRPAAVWHCFSQSMASLQRSRLEKALLRLKTDGASMKKQFDGFNPTERT